MGKTSEVLSKDLNRTKVGILGGKKPSDINNSSANRIMPVSDRDNDGAPDVSVSQELSEDINSSWLKNGSGQYKR